MRIGYKLEQKDAATEEKLTLLDSLQDLLGGLVVAQRVGEGNQGADGDSIRRLVADNAGIDDNITVSIDGDGAGCSVLDGVEHGGCVALALLLLFLLDTACVDALSLLLLVLLFAPVLGHFVCDVCGWFGVGGLELSELIAITFFSLHVLSNPAHERQSCSQRLWTNRNISVGKSLGTCRSYCCYHPALHVNTHKLCGLCTSSIGKHLSIISLSFYLVQHKLTQ
jgi:hypothetical protein